MLRIGSTPREVIEYMRTAALYLSAAWLVIVTAVVLGEALVGSERITIRSETSWAPAYVRFKEDESRRIGLTYNQMMDDLTVLYGGMEAERLLLEDVSTGAAGSDLVRATQLAHYIVEYCGMSGEDDHCLRQYRHPETGERLDNLSQAELNAIDDKVNRVIAEARQRADAMLADAQTRSEAQLRQAQEKADALHADAERKHSEIMGTINQQRTVLEGRLEQLRTFEREYRTRLKTYLESQLEELGQRGSAAPVDSSAANEAGGFNQFNRGTN